MNSTGDVRGASAPTAPVVAPRPWPRSTPGQHFPVPDSRRAVRPPQIWRAPDLPAKDPILRPSREIIHAEIGTATTGGGRLRKGSYLGVSVLTVLVILITVWAVHQETTGDAAASAKESAADTPSIAEPVTAGPRVVASAAGPSAAEATAATTPARPTAQEERPTADEELAALDELRDLRDSTQSLVRLDGHWVAQLASKYPGITDRHEISPSGDRVFSASEILALHQALQKRLGGSVMLLLSTDYGKRQKVRGHALWVSFADLNATSESEVETWCRQSFPEMSTAELANSCVPRRLRPPS